MKITRIALVAITLMIGFAFTPYSEADISWDNTVLDLGEIPHNIPAELEFTFTNSGTEPLIITNIRTSCGCTAADYPRTPIEPGETATITGSFNAKTLGRFQKSITVICNTDPSTQILTVKGVVVE